MLWAKRNTADIQRGDLRGTHRVRNSPDVKVVTGGFIFFEGIGRLGDGIGNGLSIGRNNSVINMTDFSNLQWCQLLFLVLGMCCMITEAD